MVTTFVILRPVSAFLRLGLLLGVTSLGLLVTNHPQASSAALVGALLAAALAAVTWVLGTLGGIVVLLAGAAVLLVRAGQLVVRAGRSITRHWQALLAVVLVSALVGPAAAQLVVIDPSNLVQTSQTALKMIESVINEIQMLDNQLKQIENMMQNTRSYAGMWDTDAMPRLLRLGRVIDREQAIAYQMVNIDAVFRQRYPGYKPVTDWPKEYDLWTRTTMDTLRGTLNAVRLHSEDFATEQGRIQAFQAMSDSAEGRMQALQVGNMMAAEQLQQLVKLRQLMAAQINAQNVYMAHMTNRDAQRAATQSEWIRNGNAVAPALDRPALDRGPR